MLAVHVQSYVCVSVYVYVCMCICMRASPPSREHGAVERMRNVGVEEVREDEKRRGGERGQSGG